MCLVTSVDTLVRLHASSVVTVQVICAQPSITHLLTGEGEAQHRCLHCSGPDSQGMVYQAEMVCDKIIG